MQSVADAKGKSKSGAARWSVMHMNKKCSLKEKLCESHIEEFDTIDRKDAWRSVLQSFACLYIEELENNANKAHDELSKKIDDILATPLNSMDNIQKECIYFIAGAMIKASNNKIQQQSYIRLSEGVSASTGHVTDDDKRGGNRSGSADTSC